MKALSLWQPWATLIQVGVKWIETRSWRTAYRGPLAIHAGCSRSAIGDLVGDFRFEWWYSDVVHDPFRCYCDDGVGPPCDRTATRYPCLTRDERFVADAPLGAIVATCTLVDVAPIGGPMGFRTGTVEGDQGDFPGQAVVVRHPSLGPLAESLILDTAETATVDITDQLPYGDFAPGRWAWLLADIEPVDPPVQRKGYQGLWNLPDGWRQAA